MAFSDGFQKHAVVLVKPRKRIRRLDAPKHGSKPQEAVDGRSVVFALEKHVGVADHDGIDLIREGGKRSPQIRFRVVRVVQVIAQHHADPCVIHAADIVCFQNAQRGIRVRQQQMRLCDLRSNGNLADGFVLILRNQFTGVLQQFNRPKNGFPASGVFAEFQIEQAALIHEVKMVRIALQRLFRFRDGFGAALLLPERGNPVKAGRRASVLPFVSEQHVRRRVKQLRQFRNQTQLRRGLSGFPFVHGADADAHRFRELLLCQIFFPAESPDVLRQLSLHLRTSLLPIPEFYSKTALQGRNRR